MGEGQELVGVIFQGGKIFDLGELTREESTKS